MGTSSEMYTGDQAELEAVISKCRVVSFRHIEALGQPTKICGIGT